MPSKSKAQYKIMEIASYNKEFADARGMDQKAAQEWHNEDKKKRKEEPKWYDALPEKAEKKPPAKPKKEKKPAKRKKVKGESSNEGLIGALKSLFTGDEKEDVDFAALAKDPKLLDDVELRTDAINMRGPSMNFKLKGFNMRWLSGVEHTINEVEPWLRKFVKARSDYGNELEKINKQSHAMTPKDAITFIAPKIIAAKVKLAAVGVPKMAETTAVWSKKAAHGQNLKFGSIPDGANMMQPPDATMLRKIITLIDKISKVLDWTEENNQIPWSLDDTEEYEFWENKDASESEISKLMDHYPQAGEFMEFDYGDDVQHYLEYVMHGLRSTVAKTIK